MIMAASRGGAMFNLKLKSEVKIRSTITKTGAVRESSAQKVDVSSLLF
jgi:hypothetical protein